MWAPMDEKEEAIGGSLKGKTLEGKKERWDVKFTKLHVLVTGQKVNTINAPWAHQEGGVLMGVVVEMVLDERWGFYENVPMFTYTLKLL